MKVKITINLENDAFADGNTGDEVARILQKLASKMHGLRITKGDDIDLRDINGNTVGEFRVR